MGNKLSFTHIIPTIINQASITRVNDIIDISINNHGIISLNIKDQLSCIDKKVTRLKVNLHYDSFTDYDQKYQQFFLPLYFMLDDLNLSIDTLILSFQTLELNQSKSYISKEVLSESDLYKIDSFLQFIYENLLFKPPSRKSILKIEFGCFTYNSTKTLRCSNPLSLLMHKNIFNINRFDLYLIENFPQNFWETFINLLDEEISTSTKQRFTKAHDIIRMNIESFKCVKYFDYFNPSKDFFCLPRILLEYNALSENTNELGFLYDYLMLIRTKYANIVVNMIIQISCNQMNSLNTVLNKAFSIFKGLLLIITKKNSKGAKFVDNSAFSDLLKHEFNLINIICFNEDKLITYQYKYISGLLFDLIVMFRISKTSRLRSKVIKKSTILLVKQYIY